MIRALATAAALVLLAGPTFGAGARTDKAEARRHFQVGVAAAESGAYAEAVVEFTRAYELSPNFAVLFNIAKAQEALGDEPAALATFERYLADGGAAITAPRRADIAAEMKQLVARTGVIVPHVTPDGARVSLDGAAVTPAAPGGGVRVKVGVHKLAAAKGGYNAAEQTVTVTSGDNLDVTLVLAPLPEAPPVPPPPPTVPAAAPATPQPLLIQLAPPPPPARSSAGTLRTLGYVIGGVGLGTLVTAGALYLNSYIQAQNAINNHCTQNLDTCQGNGRAQWQEAQNYARASQIVAIAGGALLVGGVVLIAVAPPGTGAPPGVALAAHF